MPETAPAVIVATPDQLREIVRAEVRSALADLRPAAAAPEPQFFDYFDAAAYCRLT